MRPISLTMQAFGSYGKKTTIDFTRPNQNLFLITGDTGSGKTTIFDAIVFALYGAASSTANKKDGVILQSQYIGYDTLPYVELTFSEGSGETREIYTVRRVPRHLKIVSKGKNKGETKALSSEVSLIMPDGTEYNSKETDSKLEEIVGLSKDQFMQIAMIAQGEFVELLRAKSDDKKEIFRRLFGTELYQDITQNLLDRRREKEKDLAIIKTECQTEAGHVLIPDEDEYQLIRDRKKDIMDDNLAALEEFSRLLEELCTDLQEMKSQAEAAYKKAIKERDEKSALLEQARALLEAFRLRDQAGKELEACRLEEPQIQEWTRLIPRLRDAGIISGEYRHLTQARQELARLKEALALQEKDLPDLTARAGQAAGQEEQEKERNEKEISLFSKISERVDKALQLFRQIKDVEETLKGHEKELARASGQAEALKKEKKQLEVQEQEWQKDLETLGNVDQRLAVCKAKEEQALRLKEEVGDFDRIYKETGSQKRKVEQEAQQYQKYRKLREEREREYSQVRQIFLDNQAGYIAEQLKEGEPCPVCGSRNHPNPCRFIEEGGVKPTQERVEALEKAKKEMEDKENEASRKAGEAKTLYEEKYTRYKEAGEQLRKRLDEVLEHIPEKIPPSMAGKLVEDRLKEIREEEDQLKKQKKDQERLEKNLTEGRERKSLLDRKIEEAGERVTQARADLQGSRTSLDNLKKSKLYETEEEALQDRKTAQTRRDRSQEIYLEAKKKLDQARASLHQAQTLIDRYKKEIPEKETFLEEREAAYQSLMAEKELTEDQWKELTRTYGPEKPDQLQKEVERFGRRKAEAQGKMDSAQRTIGDRERPDMEALEEAKRMADNRWSQAEEERNRCREWLRVNKQVAGKITSKMEERKKLLEEYEAVRKLYQVLSGNVKGGRMDLETFVQRYYLEKILYAANRRFREMSAGQFELRMVDSEQAGQGRNKGLDLMVYSAVTGKVREIRSLSGGESFMAALALALGMADQIQEDSAAINLDVMFVDEGFGSLDENARNQAIKVLQDMAEGSKMIGIISHVTELQQQIDDQLVIKKDEEGSHASWQLS